MRKIYLPLIFVAFTGLFSCVEEIDLILDDDHHARLVVDGMITTDTTSHTVELSMTAPYFSKEKTERVSGAEVSVSDNLGNVFDLTEAEPGIYMTDENVYGVVGRTYNLIINHDGESYHAESTMKRVMETDSLVYEWDEAREQYVILFYAKEPEGKGDKYMWHLYRNGELITDSINKVLFIDDEFFDGIYIDGLEITRWNYDHNIQKHDTVRVDTHSITEDALLFFSGIFSESGFSSGPFSPPPANIHSNISNNAIGLFFASAISRETIIIE